MKLLVKAVTALSLIGLFFSAQASLLTSDSLVSPSAIDISTLSPVSGGSGPVAIGGGIGENVTVEGVPGGNLYINYTGSWGLNTNGNWNGMALIGENTNPGSLIFAFDNPVSSVGSFMNHATGYSTDMVVNVYDASMTLLETHNITSEAPISTPGGLNAGAFRGVERLSSDIYYFEVVGAWPVVSTLKFTRGSVAVPTISEWGMLILTLLFGSIGLITLNRRRNLTV